MQSALPRHGRRLVATAREAARRAGALPAPSATAPGGAPAARPSPVRAPATPLQLDPFPHVCRAAHLDGLSPHAGVRIHEKDREGLARPCRYAVRPPFALYRLSAGADGRLVYRMKRPRGGSLFLPLTPDELIARFATLVPPPRSHAFRYHGLFAPNAKHRKRVVPARPEPCGEEVARHVPRAPVEAAGAGIEAQPTGSFALTPVEAPLERPLLRTRIPWAELLRRVFAVDVLDCPRCHGPLELIAYIAEATVARGGITGRARLLRPRWPLNQHGRS